MPDLYEQLNIQPGSQAPPTGQPPTSEPDLYEQLRITPEPPPPDVATSPLPMPAHESIVETEPPLEGLGAVPGKIHPDVSLAANSGVLYDKPAPAGHFLAGTALNEEERKKAYELSLQTMVRTGPGTGKMEYLHVDPKTGEQRWAYVNTPGLDLEDIQGAGFDMATGSASAALAGLVGAATKSPALVTGTDAAATFAGEMLKYSYGYRNGINQDLFSDQKTFFEAFNTALVTAGITATAGPLFDYAFSTAMFLRAAVTGNPIDPARAKDLKEALVDVEALQNDINKVVEGNAFVLDTAQAAYSKRQGILQEQLLSLREELINKGAIKEMTPEQDQALVSFFNRTWRPVPESGEYSLLDITDQLNAGAAAQRSIAEQRMDEGIRGAQAELDRYLRPRAFGARDQVGSMKTLRASLDKQSEAFDTEAGKAARELEAAAGDEAFISNRIVRQRLKGLTEKSKNSMLNDVNTLRLQRGETLLQPKFLDSEQRYNFSQVWETISGLKQLRRLGRETPGEYTTREIDTVIEALEDALVAADRRNPGFSKLYDRFINWYATTNNKLNRGYAGDIMRKDAGRWEIEDRDIFNNVFNNGNKGGQAELLAELTATDPVARDGIRAGIRQQYLEALGHSDFQGGIPPEALEKPQRLLSLHRRYFDNHRDQLQYFFTPDELKDMRKKPLRMLKTIDDKIARRKATLAKIDAGSDANNQLLNLTPTRLMARMRDTTDQLELKTFLKQLEDVPEHLAAAKGHYREYMFRAVTQPSAAGDKHVFDAGKMRDWLFKGPSGKPGQIDNIRTIFGDAHADNIVTLTRALDAVHKRAGVRINTEARSTTEKAILDLSRAYVGLFTREGRIITFVGRFKAKQASDKLSEAMVNPEKMRELIGALDDLGKLRAKDVKGLTAGKYIRIMGSLGMGAWIEESDLGEASRDAASNVLGAGQGAMF